MTLNTLSFQDIFPIMGQPWCLSDAAGNEVEIVLAHAKELKAYATPGLFARTPFVMMFAAPKEVTIPQGTYRVGHPLVGTLDGVLITPLQYVEPDRDSGKHYYQIAFG